MITELSAKLSHVEKYKLAFQIESGVDEVEAVPSGALYTPPSVSLEDVGFDSTNPEIVLHSANDTPANKYSTDMIVFDSVPPRSLMEVDVRNTLLEAYLHITPTPKVSTILNPIIPNEAFSMELLYSGGVATDNDAALHILDKKR
mmetsp:Transcript_16769/g.36358  ORF Transcript_16769/g.36358 Transcript_16769/m.36358 type:complete len:145 (-) Transcript_16769:799-1233(-)